jgi:hypothetical protein
MPNSLVQRHIPNDKLQRANVEFQEAATVLGYIAKALEDLECSVRNKTMSDSFTGEWAYNQAYLMGQLKAYNICKQLLLG